MKKPEIQAARQTRKIHDTPHNEVEECDATIQNARKKLEFSNRTRHAMRHTRTHRHRQDTNAHLSKRRLSLTERERQVKAFEYQKCFLHTGRNHSHEYHVADRGYHSRYQNNLAHTLLPTSKATNNPSVKIARRGRSDEILLQKDWKKVPSLEFLHFQILPISMCRRQKNSWTTSQLGPHAIDQSCVFGTHGQSDHVCSFFCNSSTMFWSIATLSIFTRFNSIRYSPWLTTKTVAKGAHSIESTKWFSCGAIWRCSKTHVERGSLNSGSDHMRLSFLKESTEICVLSQRDVLVCTFSIQLSPDAAMT